MSRLTSLLSIGLFFMMLVLPALAQDPATGNNASNTGSDNADAQPLSPQSLDALTAGIALYPDKTVEQALAAAYNPQAVAAAAALSPQQFQAQSSQFDPSIQYLATNEPELLTQLGQHLSLTTSLGIAAKTQLNDVWASVDRVRAQYQQSTSGSQENSTDSASATGNEASQEEGNTYNTYNDNSTSTSGGYVGGAGYGGAGAFAAGLVAGNSWQDLYRGRPYYPANRYYDNNHIGNNHIGDNHIGNNVDHPAAAASRIGPNVAGPAGVGGVGRVGGVGGVNTARPDGVNGGNHDWVNGVGNNERQSLANNTWGHMDNQAHESFTGRNASPANFNGPNTGRPGANPASNNFGRNVGAGPNTGRPNGGSNPGGLGNSQFGGFGGPSQGKLSPGNPSQPRNSAGPSRSPSPSRSFGGPGGGGGNRGGGRR